MRLEARPPWCADASLRPDLVEDRAAAGQGPSTRESPSVSRGLFSLSVPRIDFRSRGACAFPTRSGGANDVDVSVEGTEQGLSHLPVSNT